MYHREAPGGDRKISSKIVIFVALALTAYLMFSYANQVYKDYQVEQQITGYQSDIVSLKEENEQMSKLIEYLKTDAFKEKKAKEILNLKQPGETVVNIQGAQDPTRVQTSNPQVPEAVASASYPQRWYYYFFGDFSPLKDPGVRE